MQSKSIPNYSLGATSQVRFTRGYILTPACLEARPERGLFLLGTAVGYDNNLNSAPIADQLALTLSGNQVIFDVRSDFRAAGAGYARFSGAGSLVTVGQNVDSRLTASITGRFSKNSDYDLIQGSFRYRLNDSSDRPDWNVHSG